MKLLVAIQELLFIRYDVDDQSAPHLCRERVHQCGTQPWPDPCFSQVPMISPDFTLGRGTYSFFAPRNKQDQILGKYSFPENV